MTEKKTKTTSLKTTKPSVTSAGNLKEYVKLCVENKIAQLNLPDGTVIQMSPLAYYDEKNMSFAPSQGEIPSSKDESGDIIDEDILFASAR